MIAKFISETISGLIRFRRGPWENLASLVIGLGVIMLLQPVSMVLYTYSFVTMLAGTAMFMVVSKFPE
ncbi:MAG: hypothetical protein U1E67_18295 [Hyphomicrobiales bacterium]